MKKKRQNVIEINGNLYDATSGLPVNKPTGTANKMAAQKNSSPTPKAPRSQGKSMDGFVGSPKNVAVKSADNKQTPKATSENTDQPMKVFPKTCVVPRQPVSRVGRGAKSSVTLNRSGVKKPVIKSVKKTPEPSPTISTTALKQADKKRLERLQHIHKSDSVSRFGGNKTNKSIVQIKTSQAPKEKPLSAHLMKTHDMPIEKIDKKEEFIQNTLAKTAIHESAKRADLKSSKKLNKKSSKKSRVGGIATAGLTAMLIAGYVAYLNIPSISMKVAANRAGFAATMPSYRPAGYGLNGPIAYSPGQVTVNFSSNTDDRKFSLRQQPTTWDSNALLENYVTKQSGEYLTYQDQGLSIYIFEGTSAAWVNGQKMYILEGDNSQLDTDQILKLATSV